jgi:hypothetical protein
MTHVLVSNCNVDVMLPSKAPKVVLSRWHDVYAEAYNFSRRVTLWKGQNEKTSHWGKR